MSNSKFFEDTVKGLFNNSACSDVVLIANSTNFYLISSILKEKAPKLFAELETSVLSSSTSTTNSSTNTAEPEKLLESLVQKICNKRSLKITDLNVKSEIVGTVLESMYGKSLEDVMTIDNLNEFYVVAVRFGMDYIEDQLSGIIEDLSNEDFVKAFKQNPSLYLYAYELIGRMASLPEDEVLELTYLLSYDDILKVLSSDDLMCQEEFTLAVAENWCTTCDSKESDIRRDASQCVEVMKCVRLEHLCPDFLVSRVKSHPHIPSERYVEVIENMVRGIAPSSRRRGHVFAIGKVDKTYVGFRLITRDEVETTKFDRNFERSYNKYNGVYCLESTKSNVLMCAEGELMHGEYYVRTDETNIRGRSIVQLKTGDVPSENFKSIVHLINARKTTGESSSDDDDDDGKVTGLFVRVGKKFT